MKSLLANFSTNPRLPVIKNGEFHIATPENEGELLEFYNQMNLADAGLDRPERLGGFSGLIELTSFESFIFYTRDLQGKVNSVGVITTREILLEQKWVRVGYLRDLRISCPSMWKKWRNFYSDLLDWYLETSGAQMLYSIINAENEKWIRSLNLFNAFGIFYNKIGTYSEITIANQKIGEGALLHHAWRHAENDFTERVLSPLGAMGFHTLSLPGNPLELHLFDSKNYKRFPADQGSSRYFLTRVDGGEDLTPAERSARLLEILSHSPVRYLTMDPTGFEKEALRPYQDKTHFVYAIEKQKTEHPVRELNLSSAFV